jgi:hypothetical protein
MSNKGLIVGALVLGYMYIKQNGGLPASAPKGMTAVPASMPASVGSGWQQIATGAVAGLLQGLVKAPSNNTSVTTIPSNFDWYNRSGNVQEAVLDMPTSFNDLVGGDDFNIRWA